MMSMPLTSDMLLLAIALPVMVYMLLRMGAGYPALPAEQPVETTEINPRGFYHSDLLMEQVQRRAAQRRAAAPAKAKPVEVTRPGGEFWPDIKRRSRAL